ncbi:MAG: hypothetical protein R6U61_07365 [Thermoplasmata archaeon]
MKDMEDVYKMKDMEDVEELKEVMETLNETVPSLISGIVEAIYSAENSEELAKNTAKFYKELVDAGMDKEQAFQLTRDFMKGRDVASLVREVVGSGNFGGGHGDIGEDIGEEIKKKIHKKMKEHGDEEEWD